MSVRGRSKRGVIGTVYKDWIQLDEVSEVSTDVSIYHHAVARQCPLSYIQLTYHTYVYVIGSTSVFCRH